MSAVPRIRVLIVDDELLARQRLRALLEAEAGIEIIGEADSGSAAVATIAGRRPDLVFLDVQMPGLDGFGVLRCTAGSHRPVVVFVTAFDEHAIRAFEVNAADYLLKPVSAARLHQAVERAAERLRSSPGQRAAAIEALLAEAPEHPASAARVAVRRDHGTDLVEAARIVWAEAERDHVRLHLTGGEARIRETLSELAGRLERAGFVRVHRSALVNRAAVRRVESVAKGGYRILLRDGSVIRAGRRFHPAVRALSG